MADPIENSLGIRLAERVKLNPRRAAAASRYASGFKEIPPKPIDPPGDQRNSAPVPKAVPSTISKPTTTPAKLRLIIKLNSPRKSSPLKANVQFAEEEVISGVKEDTEHRDSGLDSDTSPTKQHVVARKRKADDIKLESDIEFDVDAGLSQLSPSLRRSGGTRKTSIGEIDTIVVDAPALPQESTAKSNSSATPSPRVQKVKTPTKSTPSKKLKPLNLTKISPKAVSKQKKLIDAPDSKNPAQYNEKKTYLLAENDVIFLWSEFDPVELRHIFNAPYRFHPTRRPFYLTESEHEDWNRVYEVQTGTYKGFDPKAAGRSRTGKA